VRCTKISAEFEFVGHSPWVRTFPPPKKKNLALGYDVGKISAGCLVHYYFKSYSFITRINNDNLYSPKYTIDSKQIEKQKRN